MSHRPSKISSTFGILISVLITIQSVTSSTTTNNFGAQTLRYQNETYASSRFLESSTQRYPIKKSNVTSKPEVQSRHLPDLYEHRRDTNEDTRVPFWNIAHMINSIEQIDGVLEAGANGIEVDISFDSKGVPVEAYHGFPCDCGRHCHYRENLVKFITKIAELTIPPGESRLILVQFDLKLSKLNQQQKQVAGNVLATLLHHNLYDKYQYVRQHSGNDPFFKPPVRFIISINHASDRILIESFVNYMHKNRLDFMFKQIGFDVGMNDNLTDINMMWDSMHGKVTNIWQGDGLTNCANIVRGIERLKDAISIRNGQGHFRKVYYWTADVLYHIRSILRLGLDATLTNKPERVVQVLNEPEFSKRYRLATAYDDPFAQYWIQPSAWKMSAPTIGETVEAVENIHQTSTNYIKNLPDGISAALKKVGSRIVSFI